MAAGNDTEALSPEAPGYRDAAEYAPFNIERVFDPSRGEDVLIAAYAKVAGMPPRARRSRRTASS